MSLAVTRKLCPYEIKKSKRELEEMKIIENVSLVLWSNLNTNKSNSGGSGNSEDISTPY